MGAKSPAPNCAHSILSYFLLSYHQIYFSLQLYTFFYFNNSLKQPTVDFRQVLNHRYHGPIMTAELFYRPDIHHGSDFVPPHPPPRLLPEWRHSPSAIEELTWWRAKKWDFNNRYLYWEREMMLAAFSSPSEWRCPCDLDSLAVASSWNEKPIWIHHSYQMLRLNLC